MKKKCGANLRFGITCVREYHLLLCDVKVLEKYLKTSRKVVLIFEVKVKNQRNSSQEGD